MRKKTKTMKKIAAKGRKAPKVVRKSAKAKTKTSAKAPARRKVVKKPARRARLVEAPTALRGILGDPVHVGLADYPALVTVDEWVTANTRYAKKLGPEIVLRSIMASLLQAFPPIAKAAGEDAPDLDPVHDDEEEQEDEVIPDEIETVGTHAYPEEVDLIMRGRP
jgi:hypothetical protein